MAERGTDSAQASWTFLIWRSTHPDSLPPTYPKREKAGPRCACALAPGSALRRHFAWPPGGHTAVSGLQAPEQREKEREKTREAEELVGL
ncbi:Hypothetical predicted protein [Podarcis lilfordi]|uniref:Uncharacterized protein n=1 Tax=Podarcis lilfordi TaxID=74358 RepID=A0AA35L5Q4_9SAUR|nr:Hypothetical predicted protein [Podarcis lilfordi]